MDTLLFQFETINFTMRPLVHSGSYKYEKKAIVHSVFYFAALLYEHLFRDILEKK